MNTQPEQLQRAWTSLEGLSIGDAFGEQFFMSIEKGRILIESGEVVGPPYDLTEEFIERRIEIRKLFPLKQWPWTDDTEMALSVVRVLRDHGEIEPDALARSFGENWHPLRGYGAAMNDLLPRYANGEDWRQLAPQLFGGIGSWGNGAAMRVAPIGAYFADDVEAVVENSRRSAMVTHAHEEAVAGAIAVAVAASVAWQMRQQSTERPEPAAFLEAVLEHVPDSEVKRTALLAIELEDEPVQTAVQQLGNGENISAQDTVPFVLWCAAQELDHFEEALWLTVNGMGDRDTTCAMVGGIVAMFTGTDQIPTVWRARREPLPTWHLAQS